MVFNRDFKHYENFTLMSHFVAQPAEMTHIWNQILLGWMKQKDIFFLSWDMVILH